MRFIGQVVHGSGRGKDIGFPTLNLLVPSLTGHFESGVYACKASFGGMTYPAALHYGPRPTVDDSDSCEVHIIDEVIDAPPESVEIEIVENLRGIEDFGSIQALALQLQKDIDKARGILHTS